MATILIVDDSQPELTHLARMVTNMGHNVIEATSGEEALTAARAAQPDAILMDVVMPGVNGFQATREIKHSSETRHIPVILTSVKCQPVDIAWGQRQGADTYLVKPIDLQELTDAINGVLEASQQASA